SVGGDNTLFDITGTLIKGKAGTVYEGLSFAYVGTTNATVNIDISQGFADMFTNAMEGYTSVTTGIIQTEKLSLEDQNNNLEARSERVIERAEDFRDRLIEKYAKFEAQVSAAQTILAQIQAILNINNKDN
ncbi:MAG: flagellar filament capping protein FliD, partial [Chlamydiia bacterium]|nr:flagellar filament capping protein FliD [Chlamydiia bacterium]